ncbi:hypothetical protein HMPREF0793_2444 [Staphylococcus caprae M23864:W1]|nr:hypothetical protein HMPREF0793_2444 [Staphylococcus caprae M23864:W1]
MKLCPFSSFKDFAFSSNVWNKRSIIVFFSVIKKSFLIKSAHSSFIRAHILFYSFYFSNKYGHFVLHCQSYQYNLNVAISL